MSVWCQEYVAEARYEVFECTGQLAGECGGGRYEESMIECRYDKASLIAYVESRPNFIRSEEPFQSNSLWHSWFALMAKYNID